MRLRKPCEHDRYDGHSLVVTTEDSGGHFWTRNLSCPGGEFLPEDALVIERVGDLWPGWVTLTLYGMIRRDLYSAAYVLDRLAQVAADRAGGPR